MNINMRDYPVVFLSYDEPNCEENWARVQRLLPDAVRVHGVKGSDRAHKRCAAEAGSASRFWTIDGDNWLLPDAVSYSAAVAEELDTGVEIYSHCSRNPVTGLTYGNGGAKLWPRSVVEHMHTHEAAEHSDAAIDFCWSLDYVLMPQVLTETRSAETAQQAWRSAFRESVKFTQILGQPALSVDDWRDRAAEINQHRLAAWLMVGMDHRQGLFSILGARQAQTWLWRDQGDWSRIEDFDYLDQLWRAKACDLTEAQARDIIATEGQWLDDQGLPVKKEPLGRDHSRWFKRQQIRDLRNQPRRLR